MTHDHDNHDVIVEDRGGGLGTIIGVIVILGLLVAIWFFAFGPGQGTFDPSSETPAEINVDVNVPEQPASS
jgi:hypothetical protein